MNNELNAKDRDKTTVVNGTEERSAPQPGGTFSNNGKRLGIFVIAYNAESHIEETLKRIPEAVWQAVKVVYVIDDCSTDETVDKTLLLRREKMVVLRNPVNQMYGGNQKLGYQYAIDQGLDAVVMLHADGQYAPEYLEELLKPIVNNEADVAFGSRMKDKKGALRGHMPVYKFVANIILSKIQNFFSGMNLSEFHSGYRAYSTDFLRNVPFWENTNDWHFDTEIWYQARQYGCRIAEVPIPTHYGDEICRVSGIRYGMNCIIASFKYYLFRRNLFYSRIYDIDQRGIKYHEKFSDPFSSHSKIYKRLLLENIKDKKILELGVGDSSLTKRMFEAGAVIDVIEIDPRLLKEAGPYCRRSFSVDLEEIEKAGVSQQYYDIIVAADVLEHLKDPELVLSKLKKFLKKNGLLIVSLPNVANIYVRLNIFFGRFPYHTKGILDKSHLHFYTLTTAKNMLTKTGWSVSKIDITPLPLGIVFPFLLKMPFSIILGLMHGTTKLFKGLLAYQNIFYCHNPNSPALL